MNIYLSYSISLSCFKCYPQISQWFSAKIKDGILGEKMNIKFKRPNVPRWSVNFVEITKDIFFAYLRAS